MKYLRFFLILLPVSLGAVSTGESNALPAATEFRTIRSGDWNADSTWEYRTSDGWRISSKSPTTGDSITIQAGHTIIVTSDLSVTRMNLEGQVIVGSGTTLTVGSGGGNPDLFAGSTGILRIKGTLAVSGAATLDRGSTVIYNGSIPQTVSALEYANLQVDNPAGVDLPIADPVHMPPRAVRKGFGQSLAVASSVSVEGDLTLISGDVRTGTNALTLGSSARIFETGSFSVLGTLCTLRQCTTGTNEAFGGMGIEIKDRSAVAVHPIISVTRTTGYAPSDTGKSLIKRRFDLSSSRGGLDAMLVFHYKTGELNGASESNLRLYESADGGSRWVSRGGTVNSGDHTITVMGVSTLNRWAAGQPAGVPTLSSISPSAAERGATVTLTLTGSGFVDGSTIVGFGGPGITVKSVSVTAPTRMNVGITVGPEATFGSRDVTVTNPATGGGTIAMKGGFSILAPAPTISGIIPVRILRCQSTSITVAGSNFIDGITSISLGGRIVVNSFAVNSPTQIAANVSVGADATTGARSIEVKNAAPGGGSATLTAGLTIENPAPTLTSISPVLGARGDIIDVALAGTNFIPGITTVSFGGGISVNSLTVGSVTQATANITVGTGAVLGSRNVSVTNPAPGGNTSTMSGSFTVGNPVPTLTGISPSSGKRGQSTNLILSGTGFISGSTSVNLGTNILINSLVVSTSAQMTAGVTIGMDAAAGPRSITVNNVAPGGGTVILAGGLTVENPTPTLASIGPVSAVRGTSLNVTLTGSNFINDLSQVSFGPDIQVKSTSVSGPTQIVVGIAVPWTVSTGSKDVQVIHAAPGGGNATLSAALMVTNPAPSVTSVAPLTAGRGRDLDVTITGAQFISGVTSVSFGPDITVSNLLIKSLTELQASVMISPSAAVGPRPVTVTNSAPGGGSASLATGFSVAANPATEVRADPGALPQEYILQEAYPNPFNPSTRIGYGLPEDSRIRLDVHNMLGNIVAELAVGERAKGLYELQWHADNLPSGVYLIRMHAESLESTKRFIASRKVVLVK